VLYLSPRNTDAYTEFTSSIPQDNSTKPFTQQINNINSIYRTHNNPTFEITDYIEPHAQHIPQRKRRCELFDVTQFLPSLSLTPLPTTHIQQELWTYKKDKAFSMTPTGAITRFIMMICTSTTIDDWKIYTCNKRGRDAGPPERQKQHHTHYAPMILERWALPLFFLSGLCPKPFKPLLTLILHVHPVKCVPTI
jgi:hypothetical protein